MRLFFAFCIFIFFAHADMIDEFDSEFKDNNKSFREDPLISYNRGMTDFNDFFYTEILFPVAKGYKSVIPQKCREMVSNTINNLGFPIRFVNNLLQFKFSSALEEFGRFFINTTFGFFGIFDHAKSAYDLKPHNEDFGQTLGYYGVSSGPHIVLPFLGPSNLRDLIGKFPDAYLDPLNYISQRDVNLLDNSNQAYVTRGVDVIDRTSVYMDQYENVKKDSFDFYIMLREIYEQRREKEIAE